MLLAYSWDAEQSFILGDLMGLSSTIGCLMRCVPRIKELNMAADGVWATLDQFAYTPTSFVNIGISQAKDIAPCINSKWFWRTCYTFTSKTPPMHKLPVRSWRRDSEHFDLMRCAVPSLFENTPCGRFCRLSPIVVGSRTISKIEKVASSLPAMFVPWDIIRETMPPGLFAMPLVRAAVEHHRPTWLLEALLFVHLLITCLLIALLLLDTQNAAVPAILVALVALDSLLVLDE
eukprot:scaffold6459_cov15-Prasinocladus_malaysianus.AAC.1